MKEAAPTRPYRQGRRAEAAEARTQAIREAAVDGVRRQAVRPDHARRGRRAGGRGLADADPAGPDQGRSDPAGERVGGAGDRRGAGRAGQLGPRRRRRRHRAPVRTLRRADRPHDPPGGGITRPGGERAGRAPGTPRVDRGRVRGRDRPRRPGARRPAGRRCAASSCGSCCAATAACRSSRPATRSPSCSAASSPDPGTDSPMARILAYTTPATGHVYPLVPGLLALRERGHDVRLIGSAEHVDELRAAGLDARGGRPARGRGRHGLRGRRARSPAPRPAGPARARRTSSARTSSARSPRSRPTCC